MPDVVLNGVRTRWFEAGDASGRPLLCLHPLGQRGAFHAGLARALGPGWRVVAYDQRGHGEAAAHPAEAFEQLVDDAEAALDRIGGRADVAGFSMGGSVAALLAARRAGGVRGLCLVATPLRGTPLFAERACAAERGSIAAIESETLLRWFGEGPDEAATRAARTSLRTMTPAGFDAAWRAFASFEGYGAIAPHLPPTLCMAFADDLSTPPPVLDEIADVIRAAGVRCERIDVDGAGHMGPLEKPREVAGAIARFLGPLGDAT